MLPRGCAAAGSLARSRAPLKGDAPICGRALAGVGAGRLGGLRLDLLTALAATGRYLPSFLLPPPSGPWRVLADQLVAIAVTPPVTVRAELDKVGDGGPLPSVLRPLETALVTARWRGRMVLYQRTAAAAALLAAIRADQATG